MKKLLLGIYACLFAIGTTSCNSTPDDELESDTPTEEKYIQVSLGFSGEIKNISESPLSRTSESKDWYAIQVYSKPQGSKDEYQHYAYGFFDNQENMLINLKEKYEYKFDVNMIVNGEEKVYKFALVKAGWTGISNSFFITSTEWVHYMYEGYLYLNQPYNTYARPNVDRFFGRAENYIPKEGGVVDIDMKRVAFGVKFVAKNFNEGSLEINVENAPTIYLNAKERNEVQDTISFNNLEYAYSSTDEYVENIPVNIIWVKANNTRIPIASQTVAFKRNKLITIEFEVKENTNTSRNSLNLTHDEVMEIGETIEIQQ